MTAEEITDRPSNHVLASFGDPAKAVAAEQTLRDQGFSEVELLQGWNEADEMNTRARWFADTDDQLRRFKNKLREGYAVLAVEVDDSETRQNVEALLHQADAEIVTHFGRWVTETKRG